MQYCTQNCTIQGIKHAIMILRSLFRPLMQVRARVGGTAAFISFTRSLVLPVPQVLSPAVPRASPVRTTVPYCILLVRYTTAQPSAPPFMATYR